MSDQIKGVMIKETKPSSYETVEKFWTDDEILELFPDDDGSLVNPLLRRAQAAESENGRLRAELAKRDENERQINNNDDCSDSAQRIMAWLRDYGDTKTQVFCDDIKCVVRAAMKAAEYGSEIEWLRAENQRLDTYFRLEQKYRLETADIVMLYQIAVYNRDMEHLQKRLNMHEAHYEAQDLIVIYNDDGFVTIPKQHYKEEKK